LAGGTTAAAGWQQRQLQNSNPKVQLQNFKTKGPRSCKPCCHADSYFLQEQQGHWQEALQQLQDGSSSAGAAAGGSKGLSPMQLSEQAQELYQQLLALPDPLPALRDAAALTAKTQGRVVGPFYRD
jgi:hypothetical protein